MCSQIYSSSSIRRICVEGYDTSLPANDVNFALRDHFSSCGEMIHVYIPRDVKSGLLNRFGFVYVRGKGAEEKALGLSGRDMGGRIVVAKPYPFHETYLDAEVAPMKAAACPRQRTMVVTGYDTSLPQDVVETMLSMRFYPCGRLSFVVPELPMRFYPYGRLSFAVPELPRGRLHSLAMVYLWGEDAVEKAMQLSGRDVRGLNLVVVKVCSPDKDYGNCGYVPRPSPN